MARLVARFGTWLAMWFAMGLLFWIALWAHIESDINEESYECPNRFLFLHPVLNSLSSKLTLERMLEEGVYKQNMA